MPSKYGPELRRRALRMLAEARSEHESLTAACRHVGGLLGVSPETLRVWQCRYDIDTGVKPDTSIDMAEENRRLRREVTELRKANEVLEAASVIFEGTRPATNEMIAFIDEHRDRFGVEFLCRTLRAAVRGFLTSRGYRAAKQRTPSARQLRDELLVPEIQRLHAKHYGVYGRRKMHALLKREGWDIGRDQTERLMRLVGVRGVRKSKRVFATQPNKTMVLPADLVSRRFVADEPRKL